MRRNLSILFCLLALTAQAPAQLSTNPNKFLGNITTYGSVNPSGFEYKSLWNQITCENETKWQSVEGTRGSYSWYGADNAYNYAKNNNILFKFHTLVWGSQYPSWFTSSLSVQERYNAIVKWMDAVKAHYPNLEMIDVVNEAVGTHQAGNPLMKESLGGGGKTGYDWLIKAFELAYERWPNAILIYNDFNTFQWDTDAYIELVRTLRDAGAPIDAYGCQSHDVNDISASTLQSTMTRIQNELKLPMYITELDINLSDNDKQKTQLQNIFPMMWEADYCAGVTLWGYVYGATWVDYSGLYKNGSPRPAMTWLIDYMKSDAAKTAKSPFPGLKKEASLYIKPGASYLNTPMNINIRASLRTKTIEKVELYVDGALSTTLTEAPFISHYVPTVLGKHTAKAILYATDGNKYERIANFTTGGERSPFKDMSLPGTIEAEDFDISGEGTSYHDSESANRGGASYRTDGAGVDVTSISAGQYAVCNTASGEWIEYTVDITESGTYSYDAYVSSSATGGKLNIALTTDGTYKSLADLTIPQTTTDNTNVFKAVHGRLTLEEGQHIIMLTISSGDYKIDKIEFNRVEIDNNLKTTVTASPARALAKNPVTLTATTSPETTAIKSIRFYVDNVFMDEKTEAPFETEYTPAQYGSYIISAIAVDTDGKQSAIGTTTIKARQTYQAKPVTLPGTIEAEKFDKGGEGFTFHDSDSKNDGTSSFRSDGGGVDIYSGNGGYAIGNTKANEWLEYTVKVKEAGTYSIAITASAASKNTSFRLETTNEAGVKTDLGTYTIKNTGNVNTYATETKNISKPLEAGVQTIRLTVKTAGFYIDKIKFNLVQSGVSYIMDEDQLLNGTRYNLGGVRVDQYKSNNGITIINGKKVLIIE